MIFHVIILYCENIFFILYISTIYLLRNIVESSRTTSWRQKLNTKRARWTIAPCLPCCEKFLDREDTKVYIYTFQFNEYSFGEFRTLERLIRMTSSCIFHSIYSISKNKRSRSRNSLLCYKIGTSVLRWQGRLTNNLYEIYIYIMFSFQFFKRNYKNKVIDELY